MFQITAGRSRNELNENCFSPPSRGLTFKRFRRSRPFPAPDMQGNKERQSDSHPEVTPTHPGAHSFDARIIKRVAAAARNVTRAKSRYPSGGCVAPATPVECGRQATTRTRQGRAWQMRHALFASTTPPGARSHQIRPRAVRNVAARPRLRRSQRRPRTRGRPTIRGDDSA